MEQKRSEQGSSVGDALALTLRCARFCSASLILFASYSLAPLLIRPCHFARSYALFPMTLLVCYNPWGRLWKCLRIASSDHHGSVYLFLVLRRGFSLANVPQASWYHGLPILTVPVQKKCTLCIPALFRTSMSGILSCHLIVKKFSKASCMEVVQVLGVALVNCPRHVSHHTTVLAAPQLCRLLALCQAWFHLDPKHYHVVGQMLH